VPSLIQQGFVIAAPDTLQPSVDREYVRAFPIGRLVRARESGEDQVSIQFATHDRNAFRINANIVPPKQIITTDNRLPEARGFVAKGLAEHFEMYARPRLWAWFTWGWFSVRQGPTQSAVQDDCEKLALRVASYEPELELALREGKLGPHMRRVLLPYYVPNTEADRSLGQP
jgi:hypothetical protein